MRQILLVIFLIIGTNSAYAQLAIPGSENPLFNAGVSAWLDGEEEGAVRLFFALAREGNTAAQVFLGLIKMDPWRYADVNWLNEESVRIAVLTGPGENSLIGTPWLEVARANLPIPEMFDAYFLIGRTRDFEDALTSLPAILASGETRLSLDLILTSVNSGRTEYLFEILGSEGFPSSASWWAYYVLRNELLLDGQVASIEGISNYSDLVTEYDRFVEGDSHLLWAWLLPTVHLGLARSGPLEAQVWALEELSSVRDVCSNMCPESAPQCLVSMLSLAPSGSLLRATLSPLEALLTTDRYQTSARFEEDMLALARRNWTDHLPPSEREALERYDSCLPSLISGDQ